MFTAVALAAALPEGHHLDLTVGTDFPVLVGANLAYEHPRRLRAELSGGAFPGPYVDTTNWAMTTFEIYSDTVAALIEAALERAFVARVELGFRPFPQRGLTLSAGYQFLLLSGSTADVSVVSEGLWGAAGEFAEGYTGDLELDISPSMLTVEVGYDREVRRHLVVRGSLGFAYTVRNQTVVTPTRPANDPVEEEAMALLVSGSEDYLDYVFEKWVHLPMIGVGVGYRFY